jgi:ribonuclease T1
MTQHVTPGETFLLALAPSMLKRTLKSSVLACSVVAATLVGQVFEAHAFVRNPSVEQTTQQDVVALTRLPVQAQDVYQRILSGGPFRYEKDGTVFGNRERLLPREPRGFYREYTVPTPGARNRGARRIVCGGKIVQSPETCFYTQDHYQSFQKIDPQR